MCNHGAMSSKLAVSFFTALAVVALALTPAGAHTSADLVAVPAGSEASLKLKPGHGCSGSPTVEVAIRAPFEGAVAGDVDGWTATSTADGEGNTVLEWTGGLLPADETGEFTVNFTAPDSVGVLLTFPSVQTCENGEELAWINGDPESDFPAPRLLILPAGSEPAASIDDVPADAPGRDQLVAVVDVDGGDTTVTTEDATESSAPAETTTTSSAEETDSTSDDADADDVAAPTETNDGSDDSEDSNTLILVAAVLAAVAVGAGVVVAMRRRPTT